MLLCLLLLLAAQDPQQLINEAVQSGKPGVVIPAGTYRLSEPLMLTNVKDFDLDARGVEFVSTDLGKPAIRIFRCRTVRLRGFTLRREAPTSTQGRVDDVGEKSLDLRLHAGYPDLVENPVGYVFDPKRREIKAGTQDLSPSRVERLSSGRWRLHFSEKPAAVEVGDRLAFRGRVTTDLYIGSSAAIAVEDVAIRNGAGFCVHEDGGEGGSRYRFSVTYGPTPAGADEPPLLACNADAFHSSGARQGPTIEGCSFEGMGDDGVAIHGAYALIVEQREKSWVATDGVLREGDPLRLFTPDGSPAGEARVVSVKRLGTYAPAGKSRFHGFADLAQRRFVEVETDPALAAGFDWTAGNPAACGRGYVVRNNTIRNHRARGMLLKADDGLVEGNTIEGSTIAGIVLAPELWWREACYSRNVVIRENTIRRCGTAGVGPWTWQAGALSVTAETKPGAAPGHRNLRIENNRFEGNDGVNLLLQAVDGAQVKGNRFEDACRAACRRGSGRQIDAASLIWVSQSRNVRFESNAVVRPGGALSKRIGIGPESENVTGLDSGLSSDR